MANVVVNGCSGMESNEEKKKLDDDLVVFMRKRSEIKPRYTARLKTYVDLKQKRRRAAAARRHTEYRHNHDSSATRKKNADQKDKSADNLQHASPEGRVNKRRAEKVVHKPRSLSRSRSGEPEDACGRRRRRKRRKRSCRRRSRRRRRRRRSCGRRRRRSRSRRRRRRSACRRRRRRRRRCR